MTDRFAYPTGYRPPPRSLVIVWGLLPGPRQSRPGLGEMTNEEVGGSIRYGVGVDAEEHVIGSFDPLHFAGSTDCLQRLMHQCALFRR